MYQSVTGAYDEAGEEEDKTVVRMIIRGVGLSGSRLWRDGGSLVEHVSVLLCIRRLLGDWVCSMGPSPLRIRSPIRSRMELVSRYGREPT